MSQACGMSAAMFGHGTGREKSHAPRSWVCCLPSTNQSASRIPVLSLPPKLASRCRPVVAGQLHSGPDGPLMVGALGSVSETSAANSDTQA